MKPEQLFPTFATYWRGGAKALVRFESQASALLNRFGPQIRVILLFGYLALEGAYVLSLPLIPDEFANAKHIARVFESVPYRDYTPYKPLLGYLIEAPALYLTSDPWWSLVAVKLWIALLVGFCGWGLSRWLAKSFGEPASIGSLILLLTSSTFLERSAELRVDMLATLFGTAAYVALISERYRWAGVLAGLSVLCTQKAVYFPLAGGAGLVALWIHQRSARSLYALLKYTGAGLSVGVVYFLIASSLGGMGRAIESIFVQPSTIAFDDLYPDVWGNFWLQTLSRNPGSYGFALGAWLIVAVRGRRVAQGPVLLTFSAALVSLCWWHRQPWPYFFVFFLPTLAVISAAGLSQFRAKRFAPCLVGLFVLVSAVRSLQKRVPVVLAFSQDRQSNIIRRADSVVSERDEYLAGVELLWQRQHLPWLSWLDHPRVKYHSNHPQEFAARLKEARKVRYVIYTDVLQVLPPPFHTWLEENYVSAGGNVLFYAPRAAAGATTVDFGSGGLFEVADEEGNLVAIDGHAPVAVHLNGQGAHLIRLSPGKHRVETKAPVRFLALPDSGKPAWFQKEPTSPFNWNAYLY